MSGSDPGLHASIEQAQSRVSLTISDRGLLTTAALRSPLRLAHATSCYYLDVLPEQRAIEEQGLAVSRGRCRPAGDNSRSVASNACMGSAYAVASSALQVVAHAGAKCRE